MFTMFVALTLAWILTFALPVDGVCTTARFQILASNNDFRKVKLLSQSTDGNVNGINEDCTNKTVLDSVVANKMRLDKLEERVKQLEEMKGTAGSIIQPNHPLIQERISFSAMVNASLGDTVLDSTIIFRQISKNNGNAYSGDTGIFTVNVEGIYVFMVQVQGADSALAMELNKNNVGVMWLYVNGPDQGANSNTAILQLDVGDKVKVVKKDTKKAPRHQTFSGFML